jgi:hypothetical protein
MDYTDYDASDIPPHDLVGALIDCREALHQARQEVIHLENAADPKTLEDYSNERIATNLVREASDDELASHAWSPVLREAARKEIERRAT